MIVKEIEQQLIPLIRSLATAEESLNNLRDNHLEAKKANENVSGELKRLIEEHKTEASASNLRLTIAEKEIAELKSIIERGRSNRWSVILSLIGVAASAIVSFLISNFAKLK